LWAAWRSWASPLVSTGAGACKRWGQCGGQNGPEPTWFNQCIPNAFFSAATLLPPTCFPCPCAALIGEAITGKGILGQLGLETGLPLNEVSWVGLA